MVRWKNSLPADFTHVAHVLEQSLFLLELLEPRGVYLSEALEHFSHDPFIVFVFCSCFPVPSLKFGSTVRLQLAPPVK